MSKLGKGNRKKGNYHQGGNSAMHVAPIVAAGAKILGKAVMSQVASNVGSKIGNKITGDDQEQGGGSGLVKRGDERYLRYQGVGSYNPVVSDDGGDGKGQNLAAETGNQLQDISGSGGTKTEFYDDNENKGSQDESGPKAMNVNKGDGSTENLNQNPSSKSNSPSENAKSTTGQYARFDISQREGGKSQQPIIRKDGSVNTTLSKLIPSTTLDRMREKALIRRERKHQVDIGSIDRLTGSDYIKSIGEGGRSHRKLQKFINKQENKFERQMGRNIRKSGLGEVDFRNVTLTDDKGNVTFQGDRRDIDDNQTFSREQAANDPNISYAGTFMNFNRQGTRSGTVTSGSGVAGDGQGKKSTINQADSSKISAISGADSIKDSMDKTSAEIVKQNVTPKTPSLSSSSSSSSDGHLDMNQKQKLADTAAEMKADAKLKPTSIKAQIIKQDMPTRTPQKVKAKGLDKSGTKVKKFSKVKDKSTDKDAKVVKKLTTQSGRKLARTARKNPQLASEILGDNSNKKATQKGNTSITKEAVGPINTGPVKTSSDPLGVKKMDRKDYLTSGINPNKKD